MTDNGPGNLRWVGAAAAAVAMGCASLVLAAPAAAKNFEKHLAVNCPPPISQACAPRQGIGIDTTKNKTQDDDVFFTADPNPPACAPGLVTMYVDGNPTGPAELVQPGDQTQIHRVSLQPGPHVFEAQMTGALGGCNTGAMSGWSGTLHVTTDLT